MRRNDIKRVYVVYNDGSTVLWTGDDIREGFTEESLSMDSKERRGRQEWDTFTVHVAGAKRPVREG